MKASKIMLEDLDGKGEAKGIAKGETKAVQRLWAKRFGALPTDIDAALQTASNDAIE